MFYVGKSLFNNLSTQVAKRLFLQLGRRKYYLLDPSAQVNQSEMNDLPVKFNIFNSFASPYYKNKYSQYPIVNIQYTVSI